MIYVPCYLKSSPEHFTFGAVIEDWMDEQLIDGDWDWYCINGNLGIAFNHVDADIATAFKLKFGV